MGGAKGGADFDPTGKSDAEIMRFCQSFMNELYRHIGPSMDVPRAIWALAEEKSVISSDNTKNRRFLRKRRSHGQRLELRRISHPSRSNRLRRNLLPRRSAQTRRRTTQGQNLLPQRFRQRRLGRDRKITELGGKVITLSGPDGYIYDPDGVSGEKIDYMLEMRASNRNKVKDYADKYGCEFVAGKKPWGNVKADVYMPCARQNEVLLEDAEAMVKLGVPVLNEVSNMPTTNEAIAYLQSHGVLVTPSKAVNAGGVATSGLEMSQNSERLSWTAEEVDAKLKQIMKGIHNQICDALNSYGLDYNLVKGANLAGFKKVYEAMLAQGIN